MAMSFQEIKARYSKMETRELVALFLSTGLTDDAKRAAGQIFDDRGIDPLTWKEPSVEKTDEDTTIVETTEDKADTAPMVKTVTAVEVCFPNGDMKVFDDLSELGKEIIKGTIKKAFRARSMEIRLEADLLEIKLNPKFKVLRGRYAKMETKELRLLYKSDELTDEAKRVAEQELRLRGIDPLTGFELSTTGKVAEIESFSGSETAKKSDGGQWRTIGKLAETIPELNHIYRPKWSSCRKGILYGILFGVLVKAIDTMAAFFIADQTLGFFASGVVVAYFIGRKFGWKYIFIGAAMFIFVAAKNAHISLNYGVIFHMVSIVIWAYLGTALIGGIFGTPVGMIIGTIVGHFRAIRLSRVVEIDDEGVRPYVLGILLPAGFLAIAIPIYFYWFMNKLSEWIT